MRADAVWLARAGLGGVALSSAGLSLPRYHSRPPPAALYLVHTTQLPLAWEARGAPPQMRRLPQMQRLHLGLSNTPPLPQGPPHLLPPKSGLSERATRIT